MLHSTLLGIPLTLRGEGVGQGAAGFRTTGEDLKFNSPPMPEGGQRLVASDLPAEHGRASTRSRRLDAWNSQSAPRSHEPGRDALPRVQADRQVGPTKVMESSLFQIDLLTAHEPEMRKRLKIKAGISRFMGSPIVPTGGDYWRRHTGWSSN